MSICANFTAVVSKASEDFVVKICVKSAVLKRVDDGRFRTIPKSCFLVRAHRWKWRFCGEVCLDRNGFLELLWNKEVNAAEEQANVSKTIYENAQSTDLHFAYCLMFRSRGLQVKKCFPGIII
ncbi:unnamed protein product [Porites lobata]|uniref:Transposase n=1 Tax=Porites lobata TaxID=104759 RepID=A0ABN8NS61_9CNID|nr:unnamed protein product [Porites lobata]